MNLQRAVIGWISSVAPPPTRVSLPNRALAAVGTFAGIALTAVICGLAQRHFALAMWMVAPLGASAVQVFSVPGSPLSQPWPIVGGHIVSAVAGLAAFHLFGHTTLGAATAVGLATLLMLMTRSLHASGGGTALFVVLSGTGDWSFILFPVTTNMVCLVMAAMIFHRLTGHTYPQHQMPAAAPHQLALHRFDPADLEAALLGYNQTLDISREDVEKLIEMTEMQAYTRLAAKLTCGSLMTTALRTITPQTAVGAGIALMQRYDIKALPVVDAERKLLGLLRLDDSLKASAALPAEKIMRQTYARVMATDPATECLHILAKGDRRHVMVIDAGGRLEGMVSKSDLMGALFHAG